jgi:hypothetical protein
VNSVVSNNHDRVALISFGADPFLEQRLTTNVTEVAESLEQIKILTTVGYQGRGTILPVGARPATGSLTYKQTPFVLSKELLFQTLLILGPY